MLSILLCVLCIYIHYGNTCSKLSSSFYSDTYFIILTFAHTYYLQIHTQVKWLPLVSSL